MTLTAKTRRAIARYGESSCVRAYMLNTKLGEGAKSIAYQHDVPNVETTRQADAAIDAGRELAQKGMA